MMQFFTSSGTVVVHPEPVKKKGSFRGPEFRSKKKEKRDSNTGWLLFILETFSEGFPSDMYMYK